MERLRFISSKNATIDLHPLLRPGRYIVQGSAMLLSRRPFIHSPRSLLHQHSRVQSGSCVNDDKRRVRGRFMRAGTCKYVVNTRCEKAHIIRFRSLSSQFFSSIRLYISQYIPPKELQRRNVTSCAARYEYAIVWVYRVILAPYAIYLTRNAHQHYYIMREALSNALQVSEDSIIRVRDTREHR